jgi:hypothetical protein
MNYRSLALLVLLPVLAAEDRKSREWLTWGGDRERTGWNRGETAISRKNVGAMELKWKTQIDKDVPIDIESGASMLTTPLVVENVKTAQGAKNLTFTLAASNTLAALDSATGKVVWQRTFQNKVEPPARGSWLCTNSSTATPVIDKQKGTIYLISADGVLRGVSLSDGEDKIPPTDFVPPYSRSWSLNLIDGVMYTTVGRGCGSSRAETVASHMIAMDLNDPARPISKFITSVGRPGGAWGRGGIVWGFNSVLTQTADGAFDPATNKWGQTLLRLEPKTLKLLDYFTPPNLELLNAKDLDFGSAEPFPFTFKNWQVVLAVGKDATVYLLDSKSLGGADHRTPLFSLKIGNDAEMYGANGVWGAVSSALDAKGDRWIYVPLWGPPSRQAGEFKFTNGEAPDGSIMAFKVVVENEKPALIPMWVSRNLAVPDPPVVANGLVFAISTGENTIQRHTDPRYQKLYQQPGQPPPPKTGIMTAAERGQNVTHTILYAFDAMTGQELYSSKESIDDWTHLSSVTVAGGKVYVTTRKTIVYAFGPKK